MAHYHEKAIRAGPARWQTYLRTSPGNGPRGLGASQPGGARYAGAVDEVAINPQPRLYACAHDWRYALPLDTALVTSRVRACARGGQKTRVESDDFRGRTEPGRKVQDVSNGRR